MSWRIVPLLMLFVALAHFNRISISVAGNEQIIKSGMISETKMGLVYSSFLVLYTIFMIPGGLLIDRFGPRAAWMLLGFGAAVGVALTGAVGLVFTQALPLLVGLLVVRSLLGISNAPLHPAGPGSSPTGSRPRAWPWPMAWSPSPRVSASLSPTCSSAA